jgi:hypothetical protein
MIAIHRIVRWLLPAVALIGASASDAHAATACSYRQFNLEGPRLIANTYSYLYFFNPNTIPDIQPGTTIPYKRAKFEARLLSAARTWNFGRNRCRFPQVGGVDIESNGDATDVHAGSTPDGVSAIDLASNANLGGGGCDSPALLACTRYWPADGSEIQEADIRFDSDVRWWTGLRTVPSSARGPDGDQIYDLWSVAAHEMGHAIGIDHVSSDPNAPAEVKAQIMYFQFDPRETRRYLMGSDYRAMCHMYPCE